MVSCWCWTEGSLSCQRWTEKSDQSVGQQSQHTQAPPQLNKITINQHSQPSQVTSTISQYQYNSRNIASSNTKTLSFISVQPHLLSPGQILILRRSMRFETKNSKAYLSLSKSKSKVKRTWSDSILLLYHQVKVRHFDSNWKLNIQFQNSILDCDKVECNSSFVY